MRSCSVKWQRCWPHTPTPESSWPRSRWSRRRPIARKPRLSVGHRVAHYDVVALLGAGGMGEVYRARDARSGRDVAIKVLPDAFTRDADCVARFEREARVLASLNHPHIAALYGLEESGDRTFLVMELVEGLTLAERLVQGSSSRLTAQDSHRKRPCASRSRSRRRSKRRTKRASSIAI